MKTIGIMTFHWATNYGAVLQAYSLQEYLRSEGHYVDIINYYPAMYDHSIIRCFLTKHISKIKRNVEEYQKEKKMEVFRNRYLTRTRRYYSANQLIDLEYDAIICGSDQIWNPSYTMQGEGHKTLAYFLGFAKPHVHKISYAASFGTRKLTDDMKHFIRPALERFSSLSVRETDGREILDSLGLSAEVVCDPVFLNDACFYAKIADKSSIKEKRGVFNYILHSDEQCAAISMKVCAELNKQAIQGIETMGIEEWLDSLRNASFVVTNSFHATAFAILFHVPFITVLVRNSGMNSRITTLLKSVGLMERMVENETDINDSLLLGTKINWNEVDNKVAGMRRNGSQYLQCALTKEDK